MRAKLGTLVAHAAATLGATLDPKAAEGALSWLALLEAWNARIDLTAARSPEELVDLMLADALILAPRLPQGATTVDVGSGAGAPGLPLALLRPDLRVTLVEPRGKRASFLRTVLGAVDRADVRIERARGEALASGAWQAAISRATLAPEAWLELGARLVAPGGAVWVLVAGDAPPERPGATLEADVSYAWPLTGAGRRALAYRIGG